MTAHTIWFARKTWVRRILFVIYLVWGSVAVLNLFLAGPQWLGFLSGALAAISGGVLYYTEES